MSGPLRVLVVDDDIASGEAVRQYLEFRGLRAEAVATGEEALRRAVQGGYDIILTDLGLPDMRGDVLARRVRAGGAPVPRLVALSGESVPAGEGTGPFDLRLCKPCKPRALVEALLKLVPGATGPSGPC